MESMNICSMKNTRMIKFSASDIVIIISPLHNKIYIYKCAGVCLISINNILDISCTPNMEEAHRPLFEFDFTKIIPVI